MCWAQNRHTLGLPRRTRPFASFGFVRPRFFDWFAIFPRSATGGDYWRPSGSDVPWPSTSTHTGHTQSTCEDGIGGTALPMKVSEHLEHLITGDRSRLSPGCRSTGAKAAEARKDDG